MGPQAPKMLIIGQVWPETQTTAAGGRMIQLISCFQEMGYKLVFASTAETTPYSNDLAKQDITIAFIKINDSSFDEFIKELNPELVLFDRFLTEEQFGWRVSKYASNAMRILDTEDLHSLRYAREDAVKSNRKFNINDWLQHDTAKREMASIYRSDLSLIISTYELYLLQHHLRIDKNIVLYLPFILDNVNNLLSDRYTSYTNRNDFVFIGNGKHHPNTDAIRYLKARIWPLIKKELPETKLHIYGAYLPDAVMKLHDPEEGFIIQGHGAEVSQIMQGARINLAPLRFGAGLKGKIVDAAYNGCPSVATTIAAEGFEATSWSGSIADDPNEFASAACQLYMDEKEWYLAQKQGFKLIKHFDKKVHFQCLREHILEIKGNLNKHRAQNFIGGMLMHHTMTSTKYMSKWIEEKSLNKK